MNYKTPGVYVEEVSKFPPSVAQVETAIPAFIGYTSKGPQNEPTRITSMLEYETIFGGAAAKFEVSIIDGVATPSLVANSDKFKMHQAMQLYFANGGGPCYIVSVGVTTAIIEKAKLEGALKLLEKEDEPTLIVFPDVEGLTTTNEAYKLYEDALDHAEKMGDRFVIMDVIDNADNFRGGVSNRSSLKYGAAYYPSLQTSLSLEFDDASIKVTSYKDANDDEIEVKDANGDTIDLTNLKLSHLKFLEPTIYNEVKSYIAAIPVIMQPSSAIAGIYAKIDSTNGVWKAPANTGLNYVIAPTVKISTEEQDNLNVDVTAGKSINAIRTFTGKGTLVWGARTLDGNSNEWRYVSVRRLFNMVEESVKKATERFVFESNDAGTWVKVKAMIENFLNDQWRAGALAGATPEDAFYVSIGLGETMSAQDILEGRMNVEIGMAAVRPAEFIVLNFSHKLQES